MLFAPPDVCEDLVKANLGQEELISRLKASESDEGTMTVCSGFKYSKSKLPKSKWGSAKMPCQIVEKSDGGVKRKHYSSALKDIKPAEGVEHLVKEEEDEEKEEHFVKGCIYNVNVEDLDGAMQEAASKTVDMITETNKWVDRKILIDKLVSQKVYKTSTIRAYLTRIQQSVSASSSIRRGLNFRQKSNGEIELLYKSF
jgi:hypothetical protein